MLSIASVYNLVDCAQASQGKPELPLGEFRVIQALLSELAQEQSDPKYIFEELRISTHFAKQACEKRKN